MTLPKAKWNQATARGEVWRNLIIVQATSAREAVLKALKRGKVAEGDCGGTLRIDGEAGLTKFLGVEAMGLIHDNLDDGCEILWQLSKCRTATARHLVKTQTALISSLDSELSSRAPVKVDTLSEVRGFIRSEIRNSKPKRAVSPNVPHKR